jgi:hypothetical protein
MQAKKLKRKSRFESVRWTIGLAASEFRLNPRTVVQRAKASGIVPGSDGKFSTIEIHGAICGDYEKERTRKMKEDADQAALQNARDRGELVDKADFVSRLEKHVAMCKQKILAMDRSDEDKDVLLNTLADLLRVAAE